MVLSISAGERASRQAALLACAKRIDFLALGKTPQDNDDLANLLMKPDFNTWLASNG